VQLLVDFLTGNLGAAPQQQLAAKVVQLVIAGGSLGQLEALAAANPYSRQQTTDMEPVRCEAGDAACTLPVPSAADSGCIILDCLRPHNSWLHG
jgi:DNA polymerase delta subunit 2